MLDQARHDGRGRTALPSLPIMPIFALGEERLHPARRLADAMLVLDQGDAHIALALLAEADAGADRDSRLGEQTLGKFHRAHRPIGFGDRHPGEHARLRRRNVPAGAAEAIDQHVAAAFIKLAIGVDDILRAVERRHRRRLDRREGAVIEIGFDPRERADQGRIADRETDPPAGHRIGLRHRGELDGDLLGAGNLEDGGCRRVAEIDFGISEVADHPQIVGAGEGDDLLVEGEIGGIGRRVGRIADHQHLGLRHGEADCPIERGEEVGPGRGRNRADRGAGDDEAERMNRIARVGREHDVAGGGDRLGEIGQSFLRPERDDDLALRIEIDSEAPGIIAGLRLPEARYALGSRISVRARIAGDLGELFDDMGRRRAVGIAHAEIDDVLAPRARRCLHRIHFGEYVGRQAADAVEIGAGHSGTIATARAWRNPFRAGESLCDLSNWTRCGFRQLSPPRSAWHFARPAPLKHGLFRTARPSRRH